MNRVEILQLDRGAYLEISPHRVVRVTRIVSRGSRNCDGIAYAHVGVVHLDIQMKPAVITVWEGDTWPKLLTPSKEEGSSPAWNIHWLEERDGTST